MTTRPWRAPANVADLMRRNAIVARMKRTRAEIHQLFDDVAYWNTHTRKPDEALMDPDSDGRLQRILRWLDAQIRTAEN